MSPALYSAADARSYQGLLWEERGAPPARRAANVPGAHDQVFFCLYPPPEVAQSACRLARRLRGELALKGIPRRSRCLHVSLLGLGLHGGLPEAIIETASKAVRTIAVRRFLISFDRVVNFGSAPNRALVLAGEEGVTGIEMLRHQLLAELRRRRLVRSWDKQFAPHMTLLYDPAEVRERTVEEIGWTATELVLVRSLFGYGRHEVLGRWPLSSSSSAP